MEPEMVSTTVGNAPAFLQLRDKYKQELILVDNDPDNGYLFFKVFFFIPTDRPNIRKRIRH